MSDDRAARRRQERALAKGEPAPVDNAHSVQALAQRLMPQARQVGNCQMIGMALDSEGDDGTRQVAAVMMVFSDLPLGHPDASLTVPPLVVLEPAPGFGDMWDNACDMAAKAMAEVEQAGSAAEAVEQTPKVLCSSCGTRIFGEVADRGVCLACQDEPADG